MKEIGESFKEARSTIGISKEEVTKDLGITESQLDNLEAVSYTHLTLPTKA